MKLNKKVFAGALALAMGLGVVAPAAQSFAAPDGQVGITEDYRKAEKDYVAALKALKEAESNLEKASKAEADAKAELVKATDALDEYNEKVGKLQKDVDLYERELGDSLSKLNRHTGETVTAAYVNANYKLNGRGHVVNNNGNIVYDTAKEDLIKKVIEAYKNKNDAEAALESYKETYDALVDARDRARDHHEDTVKDLKLAQEKYNSANGAYETAKATFIVEGGNKTIIDNAERYGVYVPEGEVEEEKDLTEKIEASLKANKEKLSALKVVKEIMPESYKRYKKVIDEAVEAAEKAIKQAEDFLGKKVAFLTVAHASEEEPTAEEVLKDLEDSEKKLDDAISQVEEDNKEQNEAEEEDDKEEEKPEEKPEEEKPEEKPEVTEKEDKKPSKNVKTGVAGVAGVAAVLAAASAAYVSSKRK